jgi:hypothetical protein
VNLVVAKIFSVILFMAAEYISTDGLECGLLLNEGRFTSSYS